MSLWTGFCELKNEQLGCIKDEKFLHPLSNNQRLKKSSAKWSYLRENVTN
jgi:hypothetical protein